MVVDFALVEENNLENSTYICDNINYKIDEKLELDRIRVRVNFLNVLICLSIFLLKVYSELRFLNLGLCFKVIDYCFR